MNIKLFCVITNENKSMNTIRKVLIAAFVEKYRFLLNMDKRKFTIYIKSDK